MLWGLQVLDVSAEALFGNYIGWGLFCAENDSLVGRKPDHYSFDCNVVKREEIDLHGEVGDGWYE